MRHKQPGTDKQRRSLVVYFHRYPPEYEAIQHPGMRAMFDALLPRYDVMYFSMRGVVPPDPDVRRGIQVKEIPIRVDVTSARDKWLKTLFYYLCLPVTLLRLRAEKPAFIIGKETLPFIPSLVAILKVPMSIDVSDWWWSILLGERKWGRRFAAWMEAIEMRQWARSRAIIIAHSAAEAGVVWLGGIPTERVKIINTTLFRGVYRPCDGSRVRGKFSFDSSNFVVAVHGIIHPSKGYDQLFRWWQRLVGVHPNWKLLVIGGAGGEQWCRNEIASLGMKDNIIMSGWLPSQTEVNEHLNATDCLLVTRRNSPENVGVIPSALFHSLATGKPTMATGLPAMSEIITHEVNGYLFEPDNFESFRSVLESIAQNPNAAKQVGLAGIQRAEHCFDPEVAAAKYVEVIEDALRENA